jgi:hypothetical protein
MFWAYSLEFIFRGESEVERVVVNTTTFVIKEHRAAERGALFAETFVNIADYFMLPCISFPCEMNLG